MYIFNKQNQRSDRIVVKTNQMWFIYKEQQQNKILIFILNLI